jgi:hypothetical protein
MDKSRGKGLLAAKLLLYDTFRVQDTTFVGWVRQGALTLNKTDDRVGSHGSF